MLKPKNQAEKIIFKIMELEGGIRKGKPYEGAWLTYDAKGEPDPGGVTAYGISSRWHKPLRPKIMDLYNHGPSHPNALKFQDAVDYAKEISWDRIPGIDSLPESWQFFLTDIYFMDGIVRKTEIAWIQQQLNKVSSHIGTDPLKVDSSVGPQTVAAIKALTKHPLIERAFWDVNAERAKSAGLAVSKGSYDKGYIARWTKRVKIAKSLA